LKINLTAWQISMFVRTLSKSSLFFQAVILTDMFVRAVVPSKDLQKSSGVSDEGGDWIVVGMSNFYVRVSSKHPLYYCKKVDLFPHFSFFFPLHRFSAAGTGLEPPTGAGFCGAGHRAE
jgi:hypothetical protein